MRTQKTFRLVAKLSTSTICGTTGNTLVAENGATLRGLMERMGHASTRAALIYLHVSKGRSKHLADGLSTLIDAARNAGEAK